MAEAIGLCGVHRSDIDSDHTDQYLKDLYEKVFTNDLLLSKILSNLSLKDLSVSCQVCYQWYTEAKRVIANRSEALIVYHLFRTQEPPEQWPNTEQMRTDEELEYCLTWADKYDFKSNIFEAVSKGLQSIPEICLIAYGSFGEDVRLKHRMSQTEIVRKSLPVPTGCTIVNLNSQCLIGFPTTSAVPIEKISHFGDLAAVSLLMLPRYRPGVHITLFNGSDMREKMFRLTDIKAIVIFTTSSIFQDNRNLYLEIGSMSKFIAQSYSGGIAFGGYNSAYFSFNKKDFLNYMDTDPPTALDGQLPTLAAHELIGLCFSGPEVMASSIVLNTKRSHKTEQKLRHFKKNLGFEPLNNRFVETLVFMFTDEEKTEAFVKLNIFYHVFGNCRVVGISGYGQYGLDFWPNMTMASGLKRNRNRNNNSNNRNRNNHKAKKKIVLNTNMTTFVVINVKKKFI